VSLTGPYFEVRSYRVTTERTVEGRSPARAEVELLIGDDQVVKEASGAGPVHALDNALRSCLAGAFPELDKVRLSDYRVAVVDAEKGTRAHVRVLVRATDGEESWDAGCVSDNIIDASFEALCSTVVMGIMRARAGTRASA
jgi:2-isopropylmalate synthase